MKYYHNIIQPRSTTVWFSYQDMPQGSGPVSFSNNAANVWSFSSAARVNDIYNPSNASGDAYVAGYPTYKRLYQYMRPYKFRSMWCLDFTAVGTSIGTDFMHVFTIPTITATAPWDTLFTLALDVRYMVAVARKNRLMSYKRIRLNKNTSTGDRHYIKSKSVSLKTLLGVNPAINISSVGLPADSWSTTTNGTPAGMVYYHLLVVREFTSASAPTYQCIVTHNYNTKMLFWSPTNFTLADSEAISI